MSRSMNLQSPPTACLATARLSPSILDFNIMDASPREKYQGEEKLVISIDLGTTMSPYTPHTRFSFCDWLTLFAGAVAYTHLFPGSIPQVR